MNSVALCAAVLIESQIQCNTVTVVRYYVPIMQFLSPSLRTYAHSKIFDEEMKRGKNGKDHLS